MSSFSDSFKKALSSKGDPALAFGQSLGQGIMHSTGLSTEMQNAKARAQRDKTIAEELESKGLAIDGAQVDGNGNVSYKFARPETIEAAKVDQAQKSLSLILENQKKALSNKKAEYDLSEAEKMVSDKNLKKFEGRGFDMVLSGIKRNLANGKSVGSIRDEFRKRGIDPNQFNLLTKDLSDDELMMIKAEIESEDASSSDKKGSNDGWFSKISKMWN